VWVPKAKNDKRRAEDIPEAERDYYLEERYPSFGNLVPRDVASRAAKKVCDEGRGAGSSGQSVYMDFRDSIKRLGQQVITEKYGNLFDMYNKITGENPMEQPMRIYPAPHYTMGGLWVDYNLMSNIPGLFVLGEANFSDHGANRLGASALMQGLADGYFVIPYTLANYFGATTLEKIDANNPAFGDAENGVKERLNRILSVKGNRTADSFHKELGRAMWDNCGMSRNAEGLTKTIAHIGKLRDEFWNNVCVPGDANYVNPELEKAGRVADFLEFAELMCHDALQRNESCGGHFREEYQTEENEARRDDENYCYVAGWEFNGVGTAPTLHKEDLVFENVKLTQRSYK
jgi:succinate dehydrogenase / fumarate reductase flavoprotein subunit